jgi:uncharacterized protein with LGFP repeats
MFRRSSQPNASTSRRPVARARRSFEPTCVGQSALEVRQVLSTSSLSSAGVLTVSGTSGADTITVLQIGSRISAPGNAYATSAVKSIVVNGLDGDDSISVISSLPATLNGGAGANTYPSVPANDTVIDPTLTGGVAMSKAVMDKYQSLGGSNDLLLGKPMGNEAAAFGGRVVHFQGGEIDYSAATGAHEVHGLIGAELGATADKTDAYGHSVRGILGLATSDESAGFGGRFNHFQGGDIDWSAATGAHAVIGAIGQEYAATASEVDAYGNSVQKILGLPIGDETNVPGLAGARMQTFQGGTIYWSAQTGAHALYGAIAAYGSQGPVSVLGLPTSDESGPLNQRLVYFQHGVIAWSPTKGARILTQ